ncbi:MAG: PEGA domain-containing protein [Sandaracinaceae bacterium]|nr:PEGA domain-containing protein [Sandaracinaceae bacterium]
MGSGSAPFTSNAMGLVLAISIAGVIHAPARADNASEARLAFERGSHAYERRDFPAAVDHFQVSYRLVPNAAVAYDIARVYERYLARPIDAYNWYETALGTAGASDDLRANAIADRDRLAPALAILDVVTAPAGAEVFVERVDLGAWARSPRRVAVPAGAMQIILRIANHHAATVTVDARAGEVAAVRAELRPITTTLRVTSAPASARIVRDDTGEELGVAPFERELPIGSLVLRAILPGHVDQTLSVTLVEGEAREVELRLPREASTVATLSVSGTPPGAAVALAGRTLGTIPFTQTGLMPGTSEIEISAPGMLAVRRSILLEAGSATRLDVTLRPPSSWDWPLWRAVLYAGAAAAAGGGLVFGGLALAQQDAFYASPSRGALGAIESLAVTADVLVPLGLGLAVATLIADLLSSPPPSSEARADVER